MLEEAENEEKWDSGLKRKERLFVLHYCTDDLTFLNGTASYKAVYKDRDKVTGKVTDRSNEVCESAASRLLGKQHIKKAVSKLLTETQADLDEKNFVSFFLKYATAFLPPVVPDLTPSTVSPTVATSTPPFGQYMRTNG